MFVFWLAHVSFPAATGGSGSIAAAGRRHALIMDEVDGMAGNEDRGGIQVIHTCTTVNAHITGFVGVDQGDQGVSNSNNLYL